VVAESWSQKPPKVDVSDAGAVAIAMLQAKVHHPSDDEALQILVGEMGRLLHCCENVQSCPAGRVAHWGQVDKCLDRPTPELRPNPLVFLPHVVLGRVWPPFDAYLPEVFQARLDRALAPIQGGVEFRLQPGDSGKVDQVSSAA